ncbi:hypothetical protein BJ170DRAFT_609812 [Xylariales sp. AK1849]|nr:hypothetical protein BJ170DRAFT_609812 [Xylariales sp. AK1849]
MADPARSSFHEGIGSSTESDIDGTITSSPSRRSGSSPSQEPCLDPSDGRPSRDFAMPVSELGVNHLDQHDMTENGMERELDHLHSASAPELHAGLGRLEATGVVPTLEPLSIPKGTDPILTGTCDVMVPGSKTMDVGMQPPARGPDSVLPRCSSSSTKGKQKQKTVHFELSPEREPESGQEDINEDSIERPSFPNFQPLKPGDPGWETSADRPPVKLPIRFRDAVGRNYVFPWEKAKTWKGMERLIKACFIHVEIIGTHVDQGHYDLFGISEPSLGLLKKEPVVGSGPDEPTPSASSLSSADSGNNGTSTTGPSEMAAPTIPSLTPSPPSNNPSSSSSTTTTPHAAQPQDNLILHVPVGPIILPELWDELVVPGMLVTMHMWPLSPPIGAPPPPPPLPPAGPAGRGRGRGLPIGPTQVGMPPMPVPHNSWFGPDPRVVVFNDMARTRGKTKRRQGNY